MTAMLTEPTKRSAFVLVPAGQFHEERQGDIKAGVVHVTAGLQDLGLVGVDRSAEKTNDWALTSGVIASWARISDTDSVVFCIPVKAVAYQAKGYNTHTVGNEICNADARWDNKSVGWVKWTIWWAAVSWADIVVAHKLPLRRATKAELDRAIATDGAPVGFVDHSRLSVNRSDPGATFPWALFFKYIRAVINGATHPDRLTPAKPPAVSGSEEFDVVYLVKHRDSDDVWKSDGFKRVHVNPGQLKALQRGHKATTGRELPVLEFWSQAEVSAYGPIVTSVVAANGVPA